MYRSGTPHTTCMPYRSIQVLNVGSYRLPDGRRFTTDRDRNARICEQANRQLGVGIRHPAAWMHDPDADPVYLSGGVNSHKDAWLARGYFGEAHKFTTDAAGNVWAKVWIHRDQDAEQFDLVRQVSPGLYAGWVDEKGVKWPEMTVLHIAATPKPVQRDIGSGDPPIFLSQPARRRPGLIHLSFPATPRSVPMAEEKEELEVETEGGEADTALIASIIDSLKKLDIHGMDKATDLMTLDVALKAAAHTKVGDAGEHDEPDADDMGGESDGDMDNMVESPPPMLMGHLVTRVAQFEMKERNDRLEKLVKTGRITKPTFEKKKKQLNAINLSQPAAALFTKDGKFNAGDLDVFLEVAEELPAGPLAGRVDMGHKVVEVAQPDAGSPADREKAAAEEVKAHMAKKKAKK